MTEHTTNAALHGLLYLEIYAGFCTFAYIFYQIQRITTPRITLLALIFWEQSLAVTALHPLSPGNSFQSIDPSQDLTTTDAFHD
jgi:hypothetical protein